MNSENKIKSSNRPLSAAIKEALLADNGKRLTELSEAMTRLLEDRSIPARNRNIFKRLQGKLREMQLSLEENIQK